MLITHTQRVYEIQPDKQTITQYTQITDTATNNTQTVIAVYTIELYSNKGSLDRYSNQHTVDVYA